MKPTELAYLGNLWAARLSRSHWWKVWAPDGEPVTRAGHEYDFHHCVAATAIYWTCKRCFATQQNTRGAYTLCGSCGAKTANIFDIVRLVLDCELELADQVVSQLASGLATMPPNGVCRVIRASEWEKLGEDERTTSRTGGREAVKVG